MFDIEDMFEHEMHEHEMLQPSWCTQLDVNGMQPHSREHLEYEVNRARSERKYMNIEGQMIDYAPGIQFSGTP